MFHEDCFFDALASLYAKEIKNTINVYCKICTHYGAIGVPFHKLQISLRSLTLKELFEDVMRLCQCNTCESGSDSEEESKCFQNFFHKRKKSREMLNAFVYSPRVLMSKQSKYEVHGDIEKISYVLYTDSKIFIRISVSWDDSVREYTVFIEEL
jgi:hypothetical protein